MPSAVASTDVIAAMPALRRKPRSHAGSEKTWRDQRSDSAGGGNGSCVDDVSEMGAITKIGTISNSRTRALHTPWNTPAVDRRRRTALPPRLEDALHAHDAIVDDEGDGGDGEKHGGQRGREVPVQ